jgi:hypothetical protein
MQAQMQGMPAPPEATDADLKDAIWIVINSQAAPNRMGMPPASVVAKLKEHLDNGGSALILNSERPDSLEAAIGPWGVKIDDGMIALKELVKNEGGRKGNQIEEAEKTLQYVFIVRNYGEHPLTTPLRSLEAAMVPIVPIEYTPKDGYTGTSLIPLPPPSWGTSISELRNAEGEIKFDAKRGDKPGPIYAAAAVEKKGGGRLVVIGCLQFVSDALVRMPDQDLADQGAGYVPRFPANAELFANGVYWLSKMESMIAISPASQQVSRIAPMSEGANRGWTIGVLLVALPGLVIAAGLMMYFARRD